MDAGSPMLKRGGVNESRTIPPITCEFVSEVSDFGTSSLTDDDE